MAITFSAPDAGNLRKERGSMAQKLATNFSTIETDLTSADTAIEKHKTKHIVLTPLQGTPTALATAGVDLADGSGGTLYGVFFAPVAITVVKMYALLTEAYVKDTDDAKIEIKDNTGTPVTIFTTTLAAAGVAVGTMLSISPETGKANIAAGKRLDLVLTATASSSGTGHAVVMLEYYEQ